MALDAKELEQTTTWKNEIGKTVKSLYWFNLWFAIEGRVWKNITENMNQIREDIARYLAEEDAKKLSLDIKTDRWNQELSRMIWEYAEQLLELLDNETLQAMAQPYEKYKKDVEDRAASPLSIFSEKL